MIRHMELVVKKTRSPWRKPVFYEFKAQHSAKAIVYSRTD